MKPTALIATFTAIGGFALGWLVKPAPDQASTSQASVETGKSKFDTKSRDRSETLSLKRRGGSGGGGNNLGVPEDPDKVAGQVGYARSMKSAQEIAENARLGRLSEALGLSVEQQDAMASLLAGRRDGFRELIGSGKTAADMVAEAANAERIFQQEVAQILDPEQLEAMKAKMEREKEGDIHARASRDFADLSSQIDLSPEQREKAMESFVGASKAAFDKRPEGWAIMSESFDMFGGAYSGVMDDTADMLNQPDVLRDPRAMYQYRMQSQQKTVERTLGQLAGILTPAQLAQYRSTLNSRLTMAQKMVPPELNQN